MFSGLYIQFMYFIFRYSLCLCNIHVIVIVCLRRSTKFMDYRFKGGVGEYVISV